MGAMKTTASRETLASEHSDPAAPSTTTTTAAAAAAANGAGAGAAVVNGRSISPPGTPYQRHRHHRGDIRDHISSPCRSLHYPLESKSNQSKSKWVVKRIYKCR